ncbi:hypothetical protein GJAV_G00088750 [Gymnothorax javanicus]|nr:hypothetical protein GJAV_G00088750 [Gymnothorax javanicus]
MEIFGDQVLSTPPELDQAHRSLAAKPRQGDRPRPVIVCFHWHQTKELVVREARKQRNDLMYRDSPVRIYEDYCSDVLVQHQTGFMAERNSSFNTRRLLNIIGSPSPVIPEVVISLDAEKAFDKVEWEYLYYVLSKFGFSPDFIAWIRLLYDFPTAHILTNGVRSPSFALRRGTRQGCPLSPLLFALAVEPLAIWLRGEGRVEGITRTDVTQSCP